MGGGILWVLGSVLPPSVAWLAYGFIALACVVFILWGPR